MCFWNFLSKWQFPSPYCHLTTNILQANGYWIANICFNPPITLLLYIDSWAYAASSINLKLYFCYLFNLIYIANVPLQAHRNNRFCSACYFFSFLIISIIYYSSRLVSQYPGNSFSNRTCLPSPLNCFWSISAKYAFLILSQSHYALFQRMKMYH